MQYSVKQTISTRLQLYNLQSYNIGIMLRENAPVGKAKLRREIRVPISNDLARLSIYIFSSKYLVPDQDKAGTLVT